MTIRRLRLIAFLGFLLLVAASVAVTFAALRAQQGDALVINLAGRQRMLTQKMTLEVLGVQIGANPAYRQSLRDTAHLYFEPTLNALVAGGEAPYTDGTTVTLSLTRDPEILAQLETIGATWVEFHAALMGVLIHDSGSSAFAESVATVERLSPVMLSQMDEAVRLYEAEAARKVTRAQTIQIGFLGTAVALLIAGSFLTDRWVLGPIDQLGTAARRIGEGDLETPVSAVGLGEVDRLARGFDDMRGNLAASRAELERWAAELDACVAARTREVVHLSRVAQAANRHIEVGPLLDEVLPLLAGITGASAAWVTLLAERGAFALAGAHHLPPALETDDRAMMRWPGCLCQRQLMAGELRAAANILECERLQRAHGLPGRAGETGGLRYHASVPLRAGGQTLGLLNLTTAGDRVFDADELRLLTAVGDQVGLAIARARLHEQMKAHYVEEQATLLSLSQALLGENEAQRVMDLAVRVAAEALRVEFAATLLIDTGEQSYSLCSSMGWPSEVPPQAQHIPLSTDTAVAHTIRTRAPAVIPDHAQETRFGTPPILADLGITSSLFVPMLVAGEPIGGLGVNSRPRRNWTDDEVRLLSLIANDTAQALERAWQHAHAVERLERISALHDIDVAIASPLSLQATLEVLLQQVTERLRVDCTAIALIQPETRQLIYAARCCVDDEFFQDGLLRVKEGVAGQVAHTGQVAAIPDVRAEPRFVRAAIAERLGLVSYLAVPLQARGVILGVLELAMRQPHYFPPEEVDFFVTLAGQAAIVIDNTRMYEQAVRRAAQQRALAESAGGILATLDAEALWPAVTGAARQALAADRAAVYLYDAGADRLTCPYASGLSAEYIAELNRRFREVPGGRLLSGPRPVVIADAWTDPATLPFREMILREGFHSYAVFPLIAPDGTLGALVAYRDAVLPFMPDDVTAGQTLAHIVAVALQNARLFEATRRQLDELAVLHVVATTAAEATGEATGEDALIERATQIIGLKFYPDNFGVLLLDQAAGGLRFHASYRGVREEFRHLTIPLGQGISGQVAATGQPWRGPDVTREPNYLEMHGEMRSELCVPLKTGERTIGVINAESARPDAFNEADERLLMTLAGQLATAIDRLRAEEATRQAERRYRMLFEEAPAMYVITRSRQGAPQIVDCNGLFLSTVGYSRAEALERPLADFYTPESRADMLAGGGYRQALEGRFTERECSLVARDGRVVATLLRAVPEIDPGGRAIGTRAMFVDITERKRAQEALLRRATELEALAHIASALRTAKNADEMHSIVLEATLQVMGAQAGTFFMLDAGAQEVYAAAASGYREAVSHLRLRIGQGLAGRCWQTGAPILTDDISRDPRLVMPEVFQDLHKALCFPLRTVEGMIGVLLICFTAPGQPTPAEADLMATIGEMTGNALHRATLHEQTQRDAAELALAYDTTLEGWARALELRDQETEGHTRRVTEMALRLARAMGTFGEAELVHLRRGALLHDIGKMGIPDSILFKPGALSDEEWAIMRDHPVFAYELLSPIPYLHPALDIPYCHHEKWDGTGYPRGLKGERIPLAARIFAVADVWDALRSDRPYREGWPEETVREHIRKQAGKHFDPKVVAAFMRSEWDKPAE